MPWGVQVCKETEGLVSTSLEISVGVNLANKQSETVVAHPWEWRCASTSACLGPQTQKRHRRTSFILVIPYKGEWRPEKTRVCGTELTGQPEPLNGFVE